MRIIILSFILLLCSCCPVDSSNSIQKKKNNEIVVNCSKYRIRNNTYGALANLYEFELHGHIFLLNLNNDYKLIHAPYCSCKQTSTLESSFESNSYF